VVAIALASYLPETAGKILAALGQRPDLDWTRVAYGRLEHAAGIRGAQPLFPRIEAPAAA
jgi:methionyl-tRNA synthetase